MDNNKFQIVLKKTGNGVTLSNSTIHNSSQYIWGLDGGYIVRIDFYFDTAVYPYYSQPFSYDSLSYFYVYVAEPIDLSNTTEWEGKDGLGFNIFITNHYDYNFDRPGWYKIYYSSPYNNPITNDKKHSSGNNTDFLYNKR